MKFNILGRGWKLKIYRGYENIQNVRNTKGSKMLLIPHFYLLFMNTSTSVETNN